MPFDPTSAKPVSEDKEKEFDPSSATAIPALKMQSPEKRLARNIAQSVSGYGSAFQSEIEKQYSEPIAKIISGNVAEGTAELGKNIAPSVRALGYIAPAMMTSGASLPAQTGTGIVLNSLQNKILPFITGYGSEIVAQKLANEEPSQAQAVQSGILASYIPGESKFAQNQIAKFWPQLVKNFSRESLNLSTTQAMATTAKRSIEQGKFESYKDLTDLLSDLKLPVAAQVPFSAVQAYGDVANSYNRASQFARRQMIDALGVDSVTLANINPEQYSFVERRLFENNPKLAQQIVNQYGSFTDAMRKIFGTPADEAALSKTLNPYIGTYEKKKQELVQAENELQRAQAALDSNKDPALSSALRNSVIERNISLVRQKAATDFYSNVAEQASGVIKGSDEILNDFSNAFDNIVKARKGASEGLYNNFYNLAGIASDSPQVSSSSVVQSATKALKGAGRSGPDSEDAINAIKAFVKKTGQSHLSIDQVRSLRTYMSDAFSGKSPDRLNAAEAVASIAYGGITNALENSIKGLSVSRENPQIYQSWVRAQEYWKNTSQALSSPYGKALMQPDQRAATFKTIANQIAGGDKSAVNAWKDFVSSVAVEAPEIGAWGVNAMNSAVRDSFILNSMEGGRLNIQKLNRNLSNAASTGFDTTKIGFGDRKQLSEIQSLFDKFNPSGGNVSLDMLFNVLNNNAVQNSLVSGKGLTEVAKPLIAKQVLLQNLRNDLIQARLGVKAERAMDIMRHEKLVKEAGMTVDDIRNTVERMRSDELFTALEGKSLGLATRPGESGVGITNAIMSMDSSDAKQVMTALKNKMPEVYTQVESRIITDTLKDILVPSKTVGRQWVVDTNKYMQFFKPKVGLDPQAPVNRIRNALGKESFKRLETLMGGLSNLQEIERRSGGISKVNDIVAASAIGKSTISGSPSGGSLVISAYRKVAEIIQNGNYHLVSSLVTNPQFSKVYFASGGVLSNAVKTGVGQRVFANLPDETKREWAMSSGNDSKNNINNRK